MVEGCPGGYGYFVMNKSSSKDFYEGYCHGLLLAYVNDRMAIAELFRFYCEQNEDVKSKYRIALFEEVFINNNEIDLSLVRLPSYD